MTKKSLVAIAKNVDIQAAITETFDLLGGVSKLIKPNTTVVLKPNAGHLAKAETSVCTNPEVVRAVIKEVKKVNPKRIIVAEAAAIGCDTEKCFELSGIAQVCRDENVECIDIKRDKDLLNIPVRGAKSNITHVKLPRFLVEAEHIINLPIYKTHASMVFTGALKNIKGTVQDKVHMDMHQDNLAMAMMDVWYAVRPDLNIMDMIRPAGGYGPHTTVPMDMGCIVGSTDPVAADLVACHMVGLDPAICDYFEAAEEAGLGTCQMDDIEVVGKTIDEVYKKMWLPYMEGLDGWPEYRILHEHACSSCQALLAINMEKLKAVGEYDKHTDMVIVAGKKDSLPTDVPKDKLILHGNCLRKWKDQGIFIEGCPPGEINLYMTVMDGRNPGPDDAETIIRPRMASDEPVWSNYVAKKAKEFSKSESK